MSKHSSGTVGWLIEQLSRCAPDSPVATHANNHTFASRIGSGVVRVCRLETYGGPHVLIGNVSRRALNPPNWYVSDVLDDVERPIPEGRDW